MTENYSQRSLFLQHLNIALSIPAAAWKRSKITCVKCLVQLSPKIQLQAQGSPQGAPGTGRAPALPAPSIIPSSSDGIMRWTHLWLDTELSIKDAPWAPSPAGQGKATPGKIPKTLPRAKKCNKTMGTPKSAQPEGGKQDLLLAKGGRRPLQEPQEGKIPGCQEFGLIRARTAGRAGWCQAPSGLEMEPGPSRCSQGAATSKGSRAHPCPSHIPSPPQSCRVHPTSVGSTRNRSHRDTRLVSPAITTTLHRWFPGKSIKSLSRLWCKLRGSLPPFPWPQIEY